MKRKPTRQIHMITSKRGVRFFPVSDMLSLARNISNLIIFPDTVPIRTVNRQCSSGLQAVADVAAAIKAGFYDIGIQVHRHIQKHYILQLLFPFGL